MPKTSETKKIRNLLAHRGFVSGALLTSKNVWYHQDIISGDTLTLLSIDVIKPRYFTCGADKIREIFGAVVCSRTGLTRDISLFDDLTHESLNTGSAHCDVEILSSPAFDFRREGGKNVPRKMWKMQIAGKSGCSY